MKNLRMSDDLLVIGREIIIQTLAYNVSVILGALLTVQFLARLVLSYLVLRQARQTAGDFVKEMMAMQSAKQSNDSVH